MNRVTIQKDGSVFINGLQIHDVVISKHSISTCLGEKPTINVTLTFEGYLEIATNSSHTFEPYSAQMTIEGFF